MGKEPKDNTVKMIQPELDSFTKKFQFELDSFGKRNAPRFRLINDLKLCLDACKTPEVSILLSEEVRKAMMEVDAQMALLNRNIQANTQATAKKCVQISKKTGSGKGSKPPDYAGKEKETKMKLKVELNKCGKKWLPPGAFFELSAKPSSKPPFVDYKKYPILFSLGWKF